MKHSKKMNMKKIIGVVLAVFVGGGMMSYPFISNYTYDHRNQSLIHVYKDEQKNVDADQEKAILESARHYNESIFTGHIQLQDPFKETGEERGESIYREQLNFNEKGIMGYIQIPCINVELPIYHGTSAKTLEKGVGHLAGTSLPIGGENVHTVLTGHTGLSKAKLFTDLSALEEGDLFFLYVMNEKIAYKVDQIKIVLPEEIEDLTIEPGKDYCTLITCTPYGINSHRLLVRGERTEYQAADENEKKIVRKDTESLWMWEYKKALLIGVLLIVLIVLSALLYKKRKKKRKRRDRSR